MLISICCRIVCSFEDVLHVFMLAVAILLRSSSNAADVIA